jgi:hypothetical protein
VVLILPPIPIILALALQSLIPQWLQALQLLKSRPLGQLARNRVLVEIPLPLLRVLVIALNVHDDDGGDDDVSSCEVMS